MTASNKPLNMGNMIEGGSRCRLFPGCCFFCMFWVAIFIIMPTTITIQVSDSCRLRRRARGEDTGAPSHCPPDSVPQTPAGGLRPPAPPLYCCLDCCRAIGGQRGSELIGMDKLG